MQHSTHPSMDIIYICQWKTPSQTLRFNIYYYHLLDNLSLTTLLEALEIESEGRSFRIILENDTCGICRKVFCLDSSYYMNMQSGKSNQPTNSDILEMGVHGFLVQIYSNKSFATTCIFITCVKRWEVSLNKREMPQYVHTS